MKTVPPRTLSRALFLPLGALLLFVSAMVWSGNGIQAGPYLQDAAPDSVWVCWETASTGSNPTESRVDYGTSPLLGQSVNGTYLNSSGGTIIHQTLLSALAPDTIYYYQVITGSWTSGVYHFRTPPSLDAETPWRFAAVSDTQYDGSNPTKHREVIEEGVIDYVQAQYGPDVPSELSFLMNTGDLVSTGSNHSHWQNHFFAQAEQLLREVPLYPVLGNHEANASFYFEYMRLPQNGSPGFQEHWYYTDHQNVRLIGLDTNPPFDNQTQLDWLDTVLSGAALVDRIDFVFVQFHHPHKSELWTPGESWFSGLVVDRLEQFSTDTGKPSIHFFGHTHGYSRGQSRDHNHLWVNVATGMGNPDYWYEYSQADYPEFQISLPEWGFAIVDVEAGADPTFRLRRLSRGNEYVFRDNDLVDEITIRRYNQPPTQPTALAPNPASGSVPGFSVELVGSTFSDPDGDTLLESHWQVTTVAGDYSDPVIDDWRRIENWYRPANGDGWYSEDNVADPDIEDVVLNESLPGCMPVWWRVRYRDSSLVWSDWSDEQTFTVGISDGGDNIPDPADGANGVALAPVLEWFPCDPADAYDVYFGTTPSLGPADFQGTQTQTTFAPGVLDPEVTYYWRIDHVIGGQTTTGPTWSFTTTPTFPTLHTGEWRFADSTPSTGQPLEAAMGPSELIPEGMSYGSDWVLGTTGSAVPHIDGESTGYIRLDEVFGFNTGLRTWFNAPGNGGGGCCDVFEFTLIWDLFVPDTESAYQALWQGNASNSNDAEFFLSNSTGGFWLSGPGNVGAGSWERGEWVRIAHRVDYPDTSAVFVNGVKVLSDDELPAPDWLYGEGSGSSVWMLTDQNGGTDVGLVYCANFALVDALMPDGAIAALGGPDAEGIFVPSVPETYCTAAPNSAGPGCQIGWSGSTSIGANDFTLHGWSGIPSQFGLFYYGSEQIQIPFGEGFGCVGGGSLGFFRLNPPQLFDSFGDVERLLDFTQPPASGGPGQIEPGSTWNFQLWYRDPVGGGSGFNLSDALSAPFTP